MNKPPSEASAQSSPAGVVFEPIARTDGLPNKVRSQLLQMIAAGKLTPGDRLMPERELASELEVSRNVVREAIRSLVDANVLEARQGAGVFVASLHVESLIEPLELILALENATLHSLAQARLAIEPGIAALAAHQASDEDIEALEGLIEESGASAPDDSERLREIDVELHARVVRMTENPFLARIMESIGRLARSSRDFTNSMPRMRTAAHEDHERIVAALRARDPEAARDAMTDHLKHVERTLAEVAMEQAAGEGLEERDARINAQEEDGGSDGTQRK